MVDLLRLRDLRANMFKDVMHNEVSDSLAKALDALSLGTCLTTVFSWGYSCV